MVMRGLLSRFRRDQGGVTIVEALLSLPIVILMLTAMVELGFGLYMWNQTVRSVQLGARLAAVSAPVIAGTRTTGYEDPLEVGFDSADIGEPVPSALLSVSCGAGVAACDQARLSRLVFGPGGQCQSTPAGLSAGMCDVAPWVRPENVRVTYTRAGLGYQGRPQGVVSTVTVEVRNIEVDFILLDSFIESTGIIIPAHPVTMTSEDLSSCEDISDTWPTC